MIADQVQVPRHGRGRECLPASQPLPDEGEVRRAVATLRQAIAAGVTNFAWMKHDPDFDPIRNDPEFIELMRGQ